MSYACKCGESFDGLVQYRLHQRDDCTYSDGERDIEGQSVDETSEQIIEELLICDICEERNDGAREMQTDMTDAGLTFVIEFHCEHCGAENENTAILQ